FGSALQVAANNITEPGEDRIVADVRGSYSQYKMDMGGLLAPSGAGAARSDIAASYFKKIQPEASKLSARLDDLLLLNEQALFNTKKRATERSSRAQLSTGILALAGLILAILFAWGFIAYVVNPIRTLADKARLISEGDFDQHIDIQSRDEIGALASEFNRMAVRLRDLQKSDYSRLLMEKKKSDAVINCIREPVIVTDAFGTVTKLNDAAVSLIGDWTAKVEDDGQSVNATSDAGMRILRIVHDSVSMQRPVSGREEELLVPVNIGGTEHNYRLRTAPMRDDDGRLLGSVTLLEDIGGAIEAERVKSEFITVAAETLRNPLNSLRMALYTLAEGHLGEVSETQADMLKVARENADQLDETVNDLLEIAALDSHAKEMVIEPIRPVDVVRPAVARHQPYAEANRVTLTNKVWSDLPKVNADKRAMKLIFDNLLSNAIRHTPHEGEVTLEAWERNN
ncbi:MAG: HAMP domain-containing protein, partial [Blastocatellia bacterium]